MRFRYVTMIVMFRTTMWDGWEVKVALTSVALLASYVMVVTLCPSPSTIMHDFINGISTFSLHSSHKVKTICYINVNYVLKIQTNI